MNVTEIYRFHSHAAPGHLLVLGLVGSMDICGCQYFWFCHQPLFCRRKDPGLLVEGSQFWQHPNPEKWDKTLSSLLGLAGGLIPLAAGLDAGFGPSPEFGLGLKIIAIAVLLLGYIIGSYALIANQFFLGMVGIQAERGHYVIDTGPYRWVRHPGYLGGLITYPVVPLLLDFRNYHYCPSHKEGRRCVARETGGVQGTCAAGALRLIPGVW